MEVLSYSLGPVPLPIATDSGCLYKNSKSTLMHFVEDLSKVYPIRDEGIRHAGSSQVQTFLNVNSSLRMFS